MFERLFHFPLIIQLVSSKVSMQKLHVGGGSFISAWHPLTSDRDPCRSESLCRLVWSVRRPRGSFKHRSHEAE